MIKVDSAPFLRHRYIFDVQNISCIVLHLMYRCCHDDVPANLSNALGRGPITAHIILFEHLGQHDYYWTSVLPNHIEKIINRIRHWCLRCDEFFFPTWTMHIIRMNVV
uniref:AsIV-cont00060-ORF2 n=1 Tax=Apophua simplicipes ichnovirus TaxID=1329648 RepID=S5DYV4_9VIRU|nr:AsIV-cont00060-ORF2 [Apophua simplicipes ichnovirus]